MMGHDLLVTIFAKQKKILLADKHETQNENNNNNNKTIIN